MSKDDIEHFESRIGDKTLFQNIALFFLSASLPLLVEKSVDYSGSKSPTDLAIIVVCVAAAAIGGLFQILAYRRSKGVQTFKDHLFRREQKLKTTLQMVDSSSSSQGYQTKTVA